MAQQIGSSISLSYGQQGTRQTAGGIVLRYDVAPPAVGGKITLRSGVAASWRKSAGRTLPIDSPAPATKTHLIGRVAAWRPAKHVGDSALSAWVLTRRFDDSRQLPFGKRGVVREISPRSPWVRPARRDEAATASWAIYGDMLNEDKAGRWPTSAPRDRFMRGVIGGWTVGVSRYEVFTRPAGWGTDFVAGGSYTQDGANAFTAGGWRPVLDAQGNRVFVPAGLDAPRLNPWGQGKRIDKSEQVKWFKYSRPMNTGWGIVAPGTPTPQPGQSLIIPVRRVYIVVNETSLVRVAGSVPIPATSLSISFDCDSWLPSFTATIPESSRDAVTPDPNPVEVHAHINGSDFKFIVERIQRNRQFGKATVSISGRGIACELDSPYAAVSQHTNASAMNAQQLIDAVLTNTGYTQTWGITDWLVPAGVFSASGSPISVALAVAEASGSVLAADWFERDLRMLPRYSAKPWDWATTTPDIIVPSAVVQTESVEWIEKPTYNAVYVSGTTSGVLGQVKITGTAGDLSAPMVTNPLITHADAARQRGIAILSDTGRKAMMQISMPVLPETGVIDVCKLIEFSDGANTRRGIVRANSVSVGWPTVRQTLTVEAAV